MGEAGACWVIHPWRVESLNIDGLFFLKPFLCEAHHLAGSSSECSWIGFFLLCEISPDTYNLFLLKDHPQPPDRLIQDLARPGRGSETRPLLGARTWQPPLRLPTLGASWNVRQGSTSDAQQESGQWFTGDRASGPSSTPHWACLQLCGFQQVLSLCQLLFPFLHCNCRAMGLEGAAAE